MTNHIWAGHQDIHKDKDIFNFCDNSTVTVTWLIWTFRQLIRVMRILDLTDKKTMAKATTGYCSINKTTSIFCDPHEYPRQIEDTEQPLQSLGMFSSISHYRFFWDGSCGWFGLLRSTGPGLWGQKTTHTSMHTFPHNTNRLLNLMMNVIFMMMMIRDAPKEFCIFLALFKKGGGIKTGEFVMA